MSSSFFELNIAMSGLFAAQRGLSVTGNNITNATTPGYSRQVLEQRASLPMVGHGRGMLGTGVDTLQIKRMRQGYLDTKLWSQNDTLGEYRVKNQHNALVESVFGEPSEVGFTKLFNDIYKTIDDLSKLPTEGERKEAMRQHLISYTKYFNSASQTLSDFQKDLNFEISTMVNEVNQLAERVQSLNKQIYQSEMYGDMANSLRDERDLCIDRLSQLVNVEAEEREVVSPSGQKELQYRVKLNGQILVDHFQRRGLEVVPREEKLNPKDVNGLYDVGWEDGLDFDMYKNLSGELKGAIDMRDGYGTDKDQPHKNNTYRGIPYYIKKMDEFVSGFANHLNKIYNQDAAGNSLSSGTTANGLKIPQYILFGGMASNAQSPKTIEELLKRDENGDPVDEDGDGFADLELDAKTFSIAKELFEDASGLRTNFEHDPQNGVNPNESNNDLLLALLGTKDNPHMFKQGDPKDFMIAMFSEIGINAKEAKMYEATQTNITQLINNQRLAVSQVDTNEEFMNLVKYNQAYQVAAKLMSTIDGLYETTIFKLGSW